VYGLRFLDMESGTREFANGPLPAHLARFAFLIGDQKEWALPKPEALAYIEWCSEHGFRVLGFDVWRPDSPAPTVVVTSAGNSEGNDANRMAIADHAPGDEHGMFVFNIWVDEGPNAACPG
jgi:hypothetical protein